jgi:hypothetical protein
MADWSEGGGAWRAISAATASSSMFQKAAEMTPPGGAKAAKGRDFDLT